MTFRLGRVGWAFPVSLAAHSPRRISRAITVYSSWLRFPLLRVKGNGRATLVTIRDAPPLVLHENHGGRLYEDANSRRRGRSHAFPLGRPSAERSPNPAAAHHHVAVQPNGAGGNEICNRHAGGHRCAEPSGAGRECTESGYRGCVPA